MELTDSQAEQLRTFLEEQESDRFELRPAANLPEGYVEAVLLDPEGNATATKRVLFPTYTADQGCLAAGRSRSGTPQISPPP